MPAEPKLPSKSAELHYEQKHVLRGHSKSVVSVKFSPNGLWLASASADATLKIWDVQSGQLLRTCEGHIKVNGRCLVSPETATRSDESTGPSLHELDATCAALTSCGVPLALRLNFGWPISHVQHLMRCRKCSFAELQKHKGP